MVAQAIGHQELIVRGGGGGGIEDNILPGSWPIY